ncbi:tRNA lysidine(34) synthetase TilS [Stappia sp. MMSF_3263]|uniref:tRNA lysidine(34) synthetase TilS n=1 Tax=Stappia sp. MMSF_3263 TaxID=3046693 RepID=UPI00273DD42B|nr:tRNA lysidine(34) synthetase TilS [Stappia sp. MMSF_3263]
MAAPDRGRPVGDDEADAAFAPLLRHSCIALAVSGGADSTALLLLVASWRARRPDGPEIHILTVDHDLRRESAAEARGVAALAGRLGLPCRILVWSGPKPASNRQAGARAARQALLVAAARELGAEALVLAHHLDDQAETFLIRLARGSGVYGLAAMDGIAAWQDDEGLSLPVLRPLLVFAKERLVATCRVADVPWCEDPSNDDVAYTRTRMRALMPQLAGEGLDAETLGRTAGRLARAAAALDVLVEQTLARHATFHPAGPVRVAVTDLAGLPREVLLRLLARLLRMTGGEAYPPRLERLERLAGQLAGGPSVQSTLAGVVARRRGEMLFLWRESGRGGIAPLAARGPGRFVFDRRFELVLPVGACGEVTALGSLAASPFPRSAAGDWPVAAFNAAPLLHLGEDAAYCPGLGGSPPQGVRLARLTGEESLWRRELASNPFDRDEI